MKFGIKIFFLISLLGVVFLNGCGQNDSEALPRSRSELLIRMLDNLQKKNYYSALEQDEKLLALDPNQAFLISLREIINSNISIQQAQLKLNENNIDGAITIIETALEKFPMSIQLNETLTELRALKRLEISTNALFNAKSSIDLANAIAVLDEIITTYDPGDAFKRILNEKRKKILEMSNKEERYAKMDLLMDAAELRKANHRLSQTLEAQFTLDERTSNNIATRVNAAFRRTILGR